MGMRNSPENCNELIGLPSSLDLKNTLYQQCCRDENNIENYLSYQLPFARLIQQYLDFTISFSAFFDAFSIFHRI